MSPWGFTSEKAQQDLREAVRNENEAIDKIMKDYGIEDKEEILKLIHASRHVGRCESILKVVTFDEEQNGKS
jgi:hypothetical protein